MTTQFASLGFRVRTACLATVVVALAACDRPNAIGSANEILVAAPVAIWDPMQDEIREALNPRTFSVRDETVFDVGHVDPSAEAWGNLRHQRQVLLIGSPDEPAVAEAISRYRGDAPSPPGIIQARNVWAQNQLVTAVVLPENAPPSSIEPLLPELGELYLRQFEQYAHARMFATRPNEPLAEALRDQAGFALTLPQVYRSDELEPGVYQFRNDQPDPSRLIRNVTVDSRPAAEVAMTAEEAWSWRADLAARHTYPPQVTEPLLDTAAAPLTGAEGIQIQGLWSNPPGEWPAAGEFITRLVRCSDRVFLLDAWLYAPGIPKYEYIFQLNTILNSFECA